MTRFATALLCVPTLVVAGCANDIKFDSFSNKCDPPNFDVVSSTLTYPKFCSGTWGDGTPVPTSQPAAGGLVLGTVASQKENLVTVASLRLDTSAACKRALLTADVYQRGSAGLVPVAHGVFDATDQGVPIPDGVTCTNVASMPIPVLFNVELTTLQPPFQVVVAAGSIGVWGATLVAPDADPGAATLVRVPVDTFDPIVGDSPAYVCDGYVCRSPDNRCVANSDCDSGQICRRTTLRSQGTCVEALNACTAGDASGCEVGSDVLCVSGGICRARCVSDSDCPGFETCSVGAHESVPTCHAECQSGIGTNQCSPGSQCFHGACAETCSAVGEACASGMECTDAFCVMPRCTTDQDCVVGGFAGHESAVYDFHVVDRPDASIGLVALGLGGVARITLDRQDDGTIKFDAAPPAVSVQRSTSPLVVRFGGSSITTTAGTVVDRIYLLSPVDGLVAYNQEDLFDRQPGFPQAAASLKLSDDSIQQGIWLTTRDNQVVVLSGGYFNQDGCRDDSATTVPGESYLDIIHDDGVATLTADVARLPAGFCGFPTAGFVDESTLAVACPALACDLAAVTGTDVPLDVRLYDTSGEAPVLIQSRRFSVSETGNTRFSRTATIGTRLIVVADDASTFSLDVSIEQ